MSSTRLAAALLAAAALPLAPASAAQPYLALAAGGMRAASADTLAQQAQDKLVRAAYRTAEKDQALALLDDALATAERALRAEPASESAQLQKGLALGYRAKLTRSQSDAREAREILRGLVTDNPRSALGWAALGGWHGEAVTNMGSFLARAMVGAKTDSAMESFRRAYRLDPDDPVIRTMYAINAIGLKEEDSAAEIRALLAPVAAGSGGGALAEIMRANARTLLGVIDDPDALRRNAYDMRPFDRFV